MAGALLAAMPGPALAEVCDKERPGWDGSPATAVTEAVHLMASAPALALLLLTALAVRFRSAWGGLAVTVGWSAFTGLLVFAGDPSGIRAQAAIEGCIGSPAVFVAIVTALCAGTILYTAPARRPDQP